MGKERRVALGLAQGFWGKKDEQPQKVDLSLEPGPGWEGRGGRSDLGH